MGTPIDEATAAPFCERLAQLRRAANLTFRALSARVRENAAPGDRPLSYSYLSMLESGSCSPTPEVIRSLCRAFDGVEPDSFAEWQLWQAQRFFDPEGPGGFEGAIAALNACRADLDGLRRTDAMPPPARRGSRRRVRAAA